MRSAAWQGDWPVTQPWGCTDVAVEPWYAPSGCHFHCGVDIGMPSGTRLYALRSGIVVKRTLGILGIAVADKEVDYYIHGAYPVLLGSIVKQGQQIGLSGNIMPGGGYTTGPHLHFERQRPGGFLNEPSTSLDPAPVLFPGHYTGGDGTIVADMTPDQDARLSEALDRLRHIVHLPSDPPRGTNPNYVDSLGPLATTAQLAAAVADLKAAIQAVPGGAPADNAAVLAAIANVQAVVDKIDRGD